MKHGDLLTEHARARMQQRGISPAAIELLLSYGASAHGHRIAAEALR